jgi:potassium efflux system protein
MVRQRVAYVEGAKRKRQLEIEAAKEARKQAAAQRQQRIDAGEDVDEAPMVPVASLGELQFDFKNIEVNAGHANQLIRLLGFTAWFIGLWLVWSEVLPAIKALDEYKLWGATVATTNESDSATSTAMLMAGLPPAPSDAESDEKDSGETLSEGTGSSPVEANAPLFSLDPPTDDGVSVRDFLIFIAIVLLTFFAARNLPNAFEMLFLEDLPFDRSARYASKSIVSYAIVIVGAGLALRTLSIDWSSIQWLVTALTFGLAFGLQEIFANFVAGIILMFERPMRLGDLITVDEFTGIVTRIRTRATTIVNFDRKEYVIPNKDFITGRLVNWTLSDAINRIQFTVGVAYGSDVSKAKTLIFEICKSHPSIVDDPPTSITFEEFGDSTLNLVVRTFLGEVSSRLAVIDALHSQINTKFNEAGIEIAFPQHDLNLRTVDEDVARLLSRSDREEG